MYFYQIKPHLTTRSLFPENQESPIHFLRAGITPVRYFYKRNHFSYPAITNENFHLQINGKVTNPNTFSFNELINFPSKTLDIVLECSGNKRSKFEPKVYGEQWAQGAISRGRWRGVPLRTLLYLLGITKLAKEVVFESFDNGKIPSMNKEVSFIRSLPIEKALHPDTLIAYEYNGMPLPFKHGFPLRLIVPQWYGMASVKWLKRITVIDHNYEGPFQTDDYVYYPKEIEPFPVTSMKLNSTILQPLDFSIIEKATHTISGIAWTGEGEIKGVQVSFDNGISWNDAIVYPKQKYAWTNWSIEWSPIEKGEYVIQSKAIDSNDRAQPDEPLWNKKGYGYNAISKINVKVE
jgi:DMSO/TMAO reductase YedYZ molybdopterin-dependent catalytic subunit